jgi:disulfide oxidoreductase YuzD
MEYIMDPITTAILAVLPTLASDLIKSSVKSAYEGLKAVIKRKWGGHSSILKAIDTLEDDPKSKAQASVLEEKVADVKATEDVDVLQALHRLVEQMKIHDIGGEAVAKIQFNMSGGIVQGVAAADKVEIGSLTIGRPQ